MQDQNQNQMQDIDQIVSDIKALSPDHHIKIGGILKKHNIILNESGQHLLVNFSLVHEEALAEIATYLQYAKSREQMLTDRDEIAENMKLLLTPETNV